MPHPPNPTTCSRIVAPLLSDTTNPGWLDLGCVTAYGRFSRTSGDVYEFVNDGKPATKFLFKLIEKLQRHRADDRHWRLRALAHPVTFPRYGSRRRVALSACRSIPVRTASLRLTADQWPAGLPSSTILPARSSRALDRAS